MEELRKKGPITRSRSAQSNVPLFLPGDMVMMEYREKARKGLLKRCLRNGDHSGLVLPKGRFEVYEEDNSRLYYPTPDELVPSVKPDCLTAEEFEDYKSMYERARVLPLFKKGVHHCYMHPSECECQALEHFYANMLEVLIEVDACTTPPEEEITATPGVEDMKDVN